MNIEINGSLTEKQLAEAIRTHDAGRFKLNLEYMRGENPIVRREFKDVTAPHANVPISYARKIIKTVTGYMYKPGLVTVASENEKYLETLRDVYWDNNEDTKTAQLGEQVSLQGVGYEIHYMKGTEPRFTRVQAGGMVPVFNFEIEPDMVACIRTVSRSEDRVDVEVYYDDRIEYFWYNPKGHGIELKQEMVVPHEYEAVPVVMFRNNEEMLGDFDPVKGLIDSYDRLMSDSVNEFDRFAWAYLILKGMSLKTEDADKIKQMRVFQNLSESGDVKFLTKDVPHEFIQFMAEWIRKEIHKQTHVPDFSDDGVVSGGLSGVAMDRMLYDFEFIASTKEMFFRDGLYQRMRLLNTVLGKLGRPVGDVRDVEIIMNRNKVTSLIEQGDALQRYAGHVSERTLIEQFAPFVKDVGAEVEAIKEDQGVFGSMPEGAEEGEAGMPTSTTAEDVQAQALNGAQIKSVVDIASQVALKQLPAKTAIEILRVAIPSLSEAQALAIINPADGFKVNNVTEARPGNVPAFATQE